MAEPARFEGEDHDSGIAAQLRVDSEQTLADGEQTLADVDQSTSERDQTSADLDQVASDRDQAASDRDLASGVDADAHELTRDMRRRTTRERESSALARLDAARRRDAVAESRDLSALARDQAAAARDLAMAERDAADSENGGRADFGMEIVMRAAAHRRRAAEHRAIAAEDRIHAAQDRQAAAQDRADAATERVRARHDREMLAAQVAIAESDAVTGANGRLAGLAELDREVDRCGRTGASLVVVYLDVVGLKLLNDTVSHSAGDALLRRVVTLCRAHLRSYDLIARIGGDEFFCAISAMDIADVRERFKTIVQELTDGPNAHGLRTGFAALRGGETGAELLARADAALITSATGRILPER